MKRILRPLAINLILVTLVYVAVVLALKADRFWPFALPGQLELLAWPLLILGISLILAAEHALITVGHATGAPANPPRHLVARGIYRWVRNPIYLGGTLLLFSAAFFNRSPTLLLITLIFLPVAHAYVILVEEPRTEHRFGEEYARYKRTVSRWLPRPPKREDTLSH